MLRLLMLIAVLGVAACTDGYHCGPGDEGCTCNTDNSCDLDLRCLNGRCTKVPEVKRVFVTSQVFPGNFGGVEAADGECNYLSREAKIGGKWIAWLSSADKSAIDRIHDVGPWYLTDHRTLAFEDKAQLRGAPGSVVTKDEHTGNVAIDGIGVWTGTTASGEASASRCSDWNDTTGLGTAGSLSSQEQWSESVESACTELNRFYCFEQ